MSKIFAELKTLMKVEIVLIPHYKRGKSTTTRGDIMKKAY